MPDKVVEVPGFGNVAFPDTMSDQDIANAAGKYHAASKSREDANAVGVNYDWIADKASKLPQPLQWPAAFAGSLVGTAVEALSDPLTIASMGATAGAGRLPSAPAGTGPKPSLPTGWVPAVKAGVKEAIPKKFTEIRKAAGEAYQGARALEAAPPRLVKKAPTLTEGLEEAVRGASEQDMRETFAKGPSPSEALPGAAPGGAQAGADTMAMLKAKGQPTVTPRGKAAEALAAEPTVKLYRGESSSSTAGPNAGRYFTDDPSVALYYAKQGGGKGRIFTTELPASEAAKYHMPNAPEPGTHLLPADLAEQVRAGGRKAGPQRSLPSQEERFRTLSRQVILTPDQMQELTQLRGVLQPRASNVGLSYASGGKAGATRVGRFEIMEE